MATKTNLEKVKGKHYDIAGISTIAILESIAERVDIPRRAISQSATRSSTCFVAVRSMASPGVTTSQRRRTTCTVHAPANG